MYGQRRVALITGGAKRIGAAIAVDLAKNGFAVAVHCNRSTDEADALVAGITATGGTAAVFRADLAEHDAVSALATRVDETLGTVRAPGVYRMIDAAGEVLYVGKAKNLKNRVGSYARGQAHTTASPDDLRDGADGIRHHGDGIRGAAARSQPHQAAAPALQRAPARRQVPALHPRHRGRARAAADQASRRAQPQGRYFGPFASVWAVNRTMTALQRAFLLRTCSDSYFDNRTRPCLLFQIKRCSGPCTGEISKEDYAAMAGEARDFLAGKSSKVKERLAADMQEASEAMEFERAARYRDRLAALSAIQSSQGINTQSWSRRT
jgi:excinuclease ABC subunit C